MRTWVMSCIEIDFELIFEVSVFTYGVFLVWQLMDLIKINQIQLISFPQQQCRRSNN